MKTRCLLIASGFLAVLALTACSPPADEHEGFSDALERGATCQELFDIRNEWDPDSPKVVEANDALREIGCYSSSSTRTDL